MPILEPRRLVNADVGIPAPHPTTAAQNSVGGGSSSWPFVSDNNPSFWPMMILPFAFCPFTSYCPHHTLSADYHCCRVCSSSLGADRQLELPGSLTRFTTSVTYLSQ